MLINTVSLGGNLLMNVGPTSRGYFDSARAGGAEGLCRLDEIQFPLHLRLHHGRAGIRRARGLPLYPERPTASACICTCSPIRSRICSSRASPARSSTRSFCTTAARCCSRDGKLEHFGEALPENNDQLVLYLPPVKPDCLVPVIELFLK